MIKKMFVVDVMGPRNCRLFITVWNFETVQIGLVCVIMILTELLITA